MPELPKPPDFTQEEALTMILSSIALEEAALSHIINAEGEKIQYILSQTGCGEYDADVEDVLAVNKSVNSLLDMVLQNQMILKNKWRGFWNSFPNRRVHPGRLIRPIRLPPHPPCPALSALRLIRPARLSALPASSALPATSACPPHPPCPPSPQPPCGFGAIPCFYACGEALQWQETAHADASPRCREVTAAKSKYRAQAVLPSIYAWTRPFHLFHQ
jgi:hypothetical protein